MTDLNDMKIAIYEFLLKCKPTYEAEGEYTDTGGTIDQSKYHMSCGWQDMAVLAADLGVTIRNDQENEWEAIKRFMQNEIDASEKEAPGKGALG